MLKIALPLVALTVASSMAVDYNKTITTIYGSGNPDTGWTSETQDGVSLAMRGKLRDGTPPSSLDGIYRFDPGTVAPANTRALWNWDISINSGVLPLNAYDYYVGVDFDPTQDVNYLYLDALTKWTDSVYGTDSTPNGGGLKGTDAASSALYASIYNELQQSQNLLFYPGLNPYINATWDYVLFAVAKGAGPNGSKIASVAITVVIGSGGPAFLDSDGDGVKDSLDFCPGTPAGTAVTSNGCSIQQLLDQCAVGVVNHGDYVSRVTQVTQDLEGAGLITTKQKQKYISAAAKSSIGQ